MYARNTYPPTPPPQGARPVNSRIAAMSSVYRKSKVRRKGFDRVLQAQGWSRLRGLKAELPQAELPQAELSDLGQVASPLNASVYL